MDEMSVRMAEISNRIGQLETTIVTERTAEMDADHHVQTLTRPSGRRRPVNRPRRRARSVGRVDRHESVEEGLASWTHPRRVRATIGSQS